MSAPADPTSAHPAPPDRVLYELRPDYTRPRLEIPSPVRDDLRLHLERLYGPDQARYWLPEFERLIQVHHAHKTPAKLAQDARVDPEDIFDERDMALITYGDAIKGEGGTPLQVLTRVSREYLRAPNTIHILPFFPYSSDRGFAVMDFNQVDPGLGDWGDIRALAGSFQLMFDGVLNHVSSQSQLFRDYLDGRPEAQDFFIAYQSPDELTVDQRSKIFRPRTSDILTRFETFKGPRYLWTTFSDDQIDLNYRNPKVLLTVTESLLLYVRMGADWLRLDAVTFIWAEPGTECVHLEETHEVVKLLRTVMEAAAPGTVLITETNVPHADNISYFGNGGDEAHMVYNFALPPLTLYSFFAQDAQALTQWARDLATPSGQTHFFNMLDTHDGIGLMGVKGILSPEQIDLIIQTAAVHGALVSYKTVEGGDQEPYEINSTWWSVLNPPDQGEDLELQVNRYVASRSINLALKGIPANYIHGALGTLNDWETYQRTGHARDLNRADVRAADLARELERPGSRTGELTRRLLPLSLARVGNTAFHPRGGQEVLSLHPRVFSLLRLAPGGGQRVLALTNVSSRECALAVGPDELGGAWEAWRDLLSEERHAAPGGRLELALPPYRVLWLTPVA